MDADPITDPALARLERVLNEARRFEGRARKDPRAGRRELLVILADLGLVLHALRGTSTELRAAIDASLSRNSAVTAYRRANQIFKAMPRSGSRA